jgi:hypothetical protein
MDQSVMLVQLVFQALLDSLEPLATRVQLEAHLLDQQVQLEFQEL